MRVAPYWGWLGVVFWSQRAHAWVFACLGLAERKVWDSTWGRGQLPRAQGSRWGYMVWTDEWAPPPCQVYPKPPSPRKGRCLPCVGHHPVLLHINLITKVTTGWQLCPSPRRSLVHPPCSPSSKHWMQPCAIGRVLGDSLLKLTPVSSGEMEKLQQLSVRIHDNIFGTCLGGFRNWGLKSPSPPRQWDSVKQIMAHSWDSLGMPHLPLGGPSSSPDIVSPSGAVTLRAP